MLNRFVVNDAPLGKLRADTMLPAVVKEEQIALLEKKFENMKKVDTWKIATFWSVQK